MVKKVKLKIELKKEMEIELFHVVEGRVAVPGRGLRPAAGRTCFTEGLLLAQKPCSSVLITGSAFEFDRRQQPLIEPRKSLLKHLDFDISRKCCANSLTYAGCVNIGLASQPDPIRGCAGHQLAQAAPIR